MKRTLLALIILALAAAIGIAPAPAQDLTKLAKKTREDRLKVKQQKSVRIFNNENMPKPPAGEGPTAAADMLASPPTESLEATHPESSPPPEPGDPDAAAAMESMRGQIKQTQQKLKALEGRLRLAEDELSLIQLQQASELSPDTQTAVSAKVKERSAEVAAQKQEIEKARKEVEKLEKDLKALGGTLEVKK